MNMKAIFTVMNTTQEVVKIRPEKKIWSVIIISSRVDVNLNN